MKTAKFTHNGIDYEIDIHDIGASWVRWVALPSHGNPTWLPIRWDNEVQVASVMKVEDEKDALRARRANPSPAKSRETALYLRGGRFILRGFEYEIEQMTVDGLQARRVDTAHLPPCTCPALRSEGMPPCARHGTHADGPRSMEDTNEPLWVDDGKIRNALERFVSKGPTRDREHWIGRMKTFLEKAGFDYLSSRRMATAAYLANRYVPKESEPRAEALAPTVSESICLCPAASEYDPPCHRHGVVGIGVNPTHGENEALRIEIERLRRCLNAAQVDLAKQKEHVDPSPRPKERLDQAIQERDHWYEKYQTEHADLAKANDKICSLEGDLKELREALEEHRDVRDERDALREHLKTHQDALVEVDRQRERVLSKEHELQWLRERIQCALHLSKSPSMLGYVRDMKERFDLEPELHEQVMRVVFDCNNALDKTLTWGEAIELQTRSNNETIRERDEARALLKRDREFLGERIVKVQAELAAEREQVGLLKHALEEAQKEMRTLKWSRPQSTEELCEIIHGMRARLRVMESEIRQYQRARGWEPDEVTPEILRGSFVSMEEKIGNLENGIQFADTNLARARKVLDRYLAALKKISDMGKTCERFNCNAAKGIADEALDLTRAEAGEVPIMRIGARVRITGAKTRCVGREGVIAQAGEGGWMVLIDGGVDVFWFATHELELIPEAAQSGS